MTAATVALAALFLSLSFAAIMVGVGGGLFYVSILAASGFSIEEAIAGSLFCVVAGGSIGAVKYIRSKSSDYKTALLIGAVSAFTALSVGAAAASLPQELRFWSFVCFAVFAASLSLRKSTEDKDLNDYVPPRSAGLVFIGSLAGVLSSLFGVGGGIVVVPALTRFYKYPMKTAVGTSALTLSVTALAGFAGSALAMGNSAYPLIAKIWPLALCSFAGAYFGSGAALKSKNETLRKLFLGLLFIMITFLVTKKIFNF